MILTSQNRSLYNHFDPYEVLYKFYDVGTLLHFYRKHLQKAGLKEVFQDVGKKKPSKRFIIDQFRALGEDKTLWGKVFDTFNKELQKTWFTLLHRESINLNALEEKVGVRVADTIEDVYGWGSSRKKLVLKMDYWFFVQHERDRPGYFFGYEPSRENLTLSLPTAVREFFRIRFPKPPLYHLPTHKDPPPFPKSAVTYHCEQGMSDLLVLTDLFEKQPLELTKGGKIPKPKLRQLRQLAQGEEFFDQTDPRSTLADLRLQWLATIASQLPEKVRNSLLEEKPTSKDFPRKFRGALYSIPNKLFTLLLPHLRLDAFYDGSMKYFDKEKLSELFEFFAQQTSTDWVSMPQAWEHFMVRGRNPEFFHPYVPSSKISLGSPALRNEYSYQGGLLDQYREELLRQPLFQTTPLLLAGLGLLELKVSPPEPSSRWIVGKNPVIVPGSGVHAFRLTALGAYIFGQTQIPPASLKGPTKATLSFHPDRQQVICKKPDPATEMILQQFFESPGPGLYLLTKASLMGKAKIASEKAARIDEFQQHFGEQLPPKWLRFLSQLKNQTSPLGKGQTLKVYPLAEDPTLRQLFSQDPILKRHSAKVEGWRVAIAPGDQNIIRHRLEKFGYFWGE